MKFPLNNSSKADFLNTLAPIVVNEYLYRKLHNEKVISPTVVIAQAALESGWNLEAPSIFGIKGDGEVYDTREYINGEWIDTKTSFAKYKNLHDAVKGYYDLMQWENYDDATAALPVEPEIEGLTNNVGYPYATAPNYGATLLDIIDDYNLRIYNDYVYQQPDMTVRYILDDTIITTKGDDVYTYILKED